MSDREKERNRGEGGDQGTEVWLDDFERIYGVI